MNNAYLLLGSNQGDRMQLMHKAIDMLAHTGGNVVTTSSVYETAAWGITDQPAFLNMVIHFETALAPAELLTEIHHIETLLGRQRDVKWGQRTLDIDILLYNHDIINIPGLTIPHPHMQDRRFTLAPLAEIAPDYIHPAFNKTISALLLTCPDTLQVHKQ